MMATHAVQGRARDYSDGVAKHLPAAGSAKARGLTFAARAGYAARGAVYVLVGVLALMAAFGAGGEAEGSRGAISSLTDEPFGATMIVVLAVGLFGYALWRFVQAIADVDAHGSDTKGLVVRAGLLVSAVTHTLLALYAVNIVFGWFSQIVSSGSGGAGGGGGGGGGSGGGGPSAWVLAQPGGRWILGLIGAAVIGAGVAQFVKGYRAGFRRWLDLRPDAMRKVTPVCRFGLVARGFAFGLIGAFIIVAAWQADASETRGLGAALTSLRDEPFGPWLMGLTALGLLAFAVYSFIEAYARKIAVR